MGALERRPPPPSRPCPLPAPPARPDQHLHLVQGMLQAARALQCGRPLVGLPLAPRWLSSSPAAAKIKVGAAGSSGRLQAKRGPCQWLILLPALDPRRHGASAGAAGAAWIPLSAQTDRRPASGGSWRRTPHRRRSNGCRAPWPLAVLPSAHNRHRVRVPCCRARKCWASPWMWTRPSRSERRWQGGRAPVGGRLPPLGAHVHSFCMPARVRKLAAHTVPVQVPGPTSVLVVWGLCLAARSTIKWRSQ